MSRYSLKMPDLGEGIAEVEVVAWRVAPGDAVAEDQILADVLTDKATVEVPSPVAGRVLALGAAVGQSLAVGAELVAIELEGAAATAATGDQKARPPAPPPSARPAAMPAAAASPASPTAPSAPAGRAIASPAVRA
ncbi:MAG: 2-oxo acid dehydrogenase subunit E2, partial [Burkholderiales bacterium]|nr:2-oxo acid dehydrogenase subunit E2 [Burkholderiales bacterium]